MPGIRELRDVAGAECRGTAVARRSRADRPERRRASCGISRSGGAKADLSAGAPVGAPLAAATMAQPPAVSTTIKHRAEDDQELPGGALVVGAGPPPRSPSLRPRGTSPTAHSCSSSDDRLGACTSSRPFVVIQSASAALMLP